MSERLPDQSSNRTSLPPKRLREVTDALVGDPLSVWRMIGLYPAASARARLKPEEIYRWMDILDDAKDLELMHAPSLGAYLRAATSSGVAVAGLGLGLVGPIGGSVVATVGLVVGGLSGIFTYWDAGRLIRKDTACGERLRAIERAQNLLRAAI